MAPATLGLKPSRLVLAVHPGELRQPVRTAQSAALFAAKKISIINVQLKESYQ